MRVLKGGEGLCWESLRWSKLRAPGEADLKKV